MRTRCTHIRGRFDFAALAALLTAMALLALPSPSPGGDHIEIIQTRGNEKTADASEEENTSIDGETSQQKRSRIEDIPPQRLIEPEPTRTFPSRRISPVVSEHLVITGGSGRSKLPTDEQWQRILDILYGRAPLPPEKPPPVERPPAQPPELPPPPAAQPVPEKVPPETPPPVEKPAPEKAAPMPTREAVDIAFKVGSKGLTKEFARVAVSSGRISGSTDRKTYDFEGDFTLFYRDIVATGGKGHLDQDAETAELTQDVLVREPKYELASDELYIRFQEKTLLAKKFVQFKKKERSKEPTDKDVPKRQRVINIFKNEPTEVYCNSLSYNWDTEEMEARGEVKVVQKDFTATMDELTYNPRTKLYQMKGNVFATLHDTEWIFRHELVAPEDEDLARALAEKESTLSADFVEMGEDSDFVTIRGNARERAELSQEDKYLQANEIVVDDAKKLLTATGNVEFYQENGEWLEKGGLVEEGAEEELKKRLGKPVTSTSDSMSYDYDKRVLRQWGNVELMGENEAILADELTYDEKGKQLQLKGKVSYYRGKEEYVYADELLIDTGRNTFKFIGIVQGFMYSSEEAREKAAAAEAEAAAAEAAAKAEAETASGTEGEAGTGTEGSTAPAPPGGESPQPPPQTPPSPPGT